VEKIMKRTICLAFLTLLLIPAVALASSHGSGYDKKMDKSMDIVDMAAHTGMFNTLVAAVQAAGLEETLRSEGPFTVFAPTDEAFAKLPEGTVENLVKPENKDQLVAILTYHVVAGEVYAKDVMGLSSAKTVNGAEVPIEVKDGMVFVGGAKVTKADVKASNGVIHIIDTVMIPE
jgi:uncharacterized surface protein with fasciclin (FAS1) repeats